MLFQASMYAISRLGRRSFTLGELGIVAALGVTLMIEAMNLTLAKVSNSQGDSGNLRCRSQLKDVHVSYSYYRMRRLTSKPLDVPHLC